MAWLSGNVRDSAGEVRENVRAASSASEAARATAARRPPDLANHYEGVTSMDSVPPVPTSVYRYYDTTDILIYVGITSRGMQRQSEHNQGKEWWQYVTRQEVEHFPSRQKALRRERDLILAHNPPFNKQQNVAYEAVNKAYLMFRASRHSDVNLRDALRLMQQQLELDVHRQNEGDPIVLRSRVADSALTGVMRLPEAGRVRVFGIGKRGATVQRVDSAGPLALIRISSTTAHPIERAYAQVKFDQKQRLVLRNVHIILDHSDERLCLAKCKRNPKCREVRWVRPDGEGRA